MCRKHFTVSIYVHATVFGLFQQFFQIMQVMSAYQNTIAQITTKSLSADELTVLALKTGEIGVRTMALLDKANTFVIMS